MNKTLESLSIKDVFDNAFWEQMVTCPQCNRENKLYDLETEEKKTIEGNTYTLNCSHCNRLILDLSLRAWK